MGLKRHAKNLLDSILRCYDYQIVQSSLLYDWQKSTQMQLRYKEPILPEGAEKYLRPDNPRLKELQNRYLKFNHRVTDPLVWINDHVGPDDIKYFRGDNAYVWQLRGLNMNILGYALTTYYVKAIDHLGLLGKLIEDEYFGVFTFLIDKTPVSRDLLDSIIEIYFLEKHLKISSLTGLTIMDIGAGYGRLANRMVNALPNIYTYFCADAIAISTFVSEYYLRFLGLEDKVKVIPLDEIESGLDGNGVDIAINVHSFSECRLSAIEWWLSLLEKNGIRYLMIVPNALNHGGELLLTNDRQEFSKTIKKHGYKMIAKEPKYRDSVVQQYGIDPTFHYLFELS